MIITGMIMAKWVFFSLLVIGQIGFTGFIVFLANFAMAP